MSESLTEADRACAAPGFGCGPAKVSRFIEMIDSRDARIKELLAQVAEINGRADNAVSVLRCGQSGLKPESAIANALEILDVRR